MLRTEQAVVLFSGGIDSTTALYWARNKYDKVIALSYDYGQRHRIELACARRLTRRLRLPHQVFKVDLRQIGGSALTDKDIHLPRYRRAEEMDERIPSTYVPFRNGIFLAFAAAWAEVHKIHAIICGFNTIDSPHYPDTRAEFVRTMEKAINAGTKAAAANAPLQIVTPFLHLKKSEIIKIGLSLGADYSYSISCYDGKEIPCRTCSACLLRQKAWQEVGVKDHLLVRLKKEGKI